jgi:hypothetical protein
MMDLVHSHSFPLLYDLQKEKTWRQRAGMNVSDRVGKRVGILGYGSIGRQGVFDFILFRRFCWWKFRIPTSTVPWPRCRLLDACILDERLQ